VLQEGCGGKAGKALRVVAPVVANQHLELAPVLSLLNVLVQALCMVSQTGNGWEGRACDAWITVRSFIRENPAPMAARRPANTYKSIAWNVERPTSSAKLEHGA
jgi:hypothetical protein